MTRLCKKQQVDLTSLPLLERPCFTFSNDYISSQNKHGLVQVSDRIIARFDDEIFLSHNSENGYDIRVSGTAVSQHWGKVLLSFLLLYDGNSLFYHLLGTCILNV